MKLALLFGLSAACAWAQSGIESFAVNSFGAGTEYRVHGNAVVVKDAPFQALQRNTAGTAKVFRDGAGRTRLEREPGIAEIHDPVAGAVYVLEAARKVAHRVTYELRPPVTESLEAFNPLGAVGRLVMPEAPAGAVKPEVNSEPLGSREISGVTAEGTRTTVKYPQAPVATQEVWYAASIQANVLTILTQPGIGEVRAELVEIVAGEPDPALFRVPEGYAIRDEAPLFRLERADIPR